MIEPQRIADIKYLHRDARVALYSLFLEMHRLGFDPIVFETLRTKERQLYLFSQGRSASKLRKLGLSSKYARLGNIVTNTMQSNHCGVPGHVIAVDVISDKHYWSDKEFFDTLVSIAHRYSFKTLSFEKCHLEYQLK